MTLAPTWEADSGSLPLDRIPLFQEVEEPILKAALRDCEIRPLAAGTALLEPGQANDCIWVVLAGLVRVRLDAEGHLDEAITIPLGQCIGEFSAIDEQPVSALVRADTDARVLRITREVFWERLVLLPGVARNMMICLTERARLSNRRALAAQRERLELAQLRKELDLARQLQAGMLPQEGPLFPERSDIEVSARMEPASTVGGDFFDAFFVDDDTLFLCIGDVSGHGIGAALLMARTVGLLRILAITRKTPHKVLRRLNDSLVAGNDTSAFATLFCGFLDVPSGRLVYANGGHCPPLLQDRDGIRPLAVPPGVLVGAFPGRKYSSWSVDLAPDASLFLYTDGITEAEDGQGRPFGLEGCARALARESMAPLERRLDGLREELRVFTGNRGLDDDGTLLMLRRPALAGAAAPTA